MTFQLGEIKKRIDDFDVVVIVRGGGGDVGLSCYDDYSLSRAIATFPLPVLTGIGHSTNVSVCDMVAFKSFITLRKWRSPFCSGLRISTSRLTAASRRS